MISSTSVYVAPQHTSNSAASSSQRRLTRVESVWNQTQNEALLNGVQNYGRRWKDIIARNPILKDKTPLQCANYYDNELNPNLIKTDQLSLEEVMQLHELYQSYKGKKVAAIAKEMNRPAALIKKYLDEYYPSTRTYQWTPVQDSCLVYQVKVNGDLWKTIVPQLNAMKKIFTKRVRIIDCKTRFSKIINELPSHPLKDREKAQIVSLKQRGYSNIHISALLMKKIKQIASVWQNHLKRLEFDKRIGSQSAPSAARSVKEQTMSEKTKPRKKSKRKNSTPSSTMITEKTDKEELVHPAKKAESLKDTSLAPSKKQKKGIAFLDLLNSKKLEWGESIL